MTIIVGGNEKFVLENNEKIINLLEQKNINKYNIKIINCFNIEEIKIDMSTIVKNYDGILNTSGEKII